jgi:hypothetical protein
MPVAWTFRLRQQDATKFNLGSESPSVQQANRGMDGPLPLFRAFKFGIGPGFRYFPLYWPGSVTRRAEAGAAEQAKWR